MNANFPIHKLSDINVDCGARQSISVITAQMLLRHKEVDHVPHSHLCRRFQILIKPHRDVARWRLSPGPEQPFVLMNNKLERSGQPGLERGDINLSVSLACVPISRLEKSPFGVNRYVESRPSD